MRLYYISSQFVKAHQAAGMIQMLYTASEFQRFLADNFSLAIRGLSDKGIMDKWGLKYSISKCPSRLRVVFCAFWLPIFFIKQGFKKENLVLYCVDWHVAIPAIIYKKIFGYKIAIEYHDPPYGSWKDYMIVKFCDYLLPTTISMANYLEGISGDAKAKTHIVPNGIDIERFSNVPAKEKCREILGLPLERSIVLYAGNLVRRKGVFTLSESLSYAKNDIFIVFVGGDDNEIDELKKSVKDEKRILFAGYRPHEEIPLWIGAVDAVVCPNSTNQDTLQGRAAVKWTSPMKIFEYMAGKRPIVCSDIPAMRELLDEGMAIFVEPDNPRALAEGIMKALGDRENSNRLVENAFKKVQDYTWEKRAEKILNIFSKL